MEWERLFEDLEDQLASGWEAERAALDAESERVRISRLELRSRLTTLARQATPASLTLADGTILTGALRSVGADWVALEPQDGRITLLPLGAVALWTIDHGALLGSSGQAEPPSPLRERMSLGFVLRDVARRRIGVSLRVRSGGTLTGTIDRAGADHFDLALHDAGEPRRLKAVHGFRVVSFDALLSLTVDTAPLGVFDAMR